jgi:hypothetical protein
MLMVMTATTLGEKVMISYKKGRFRDLAGHKGRTQVGSKGASYTNNASP